MKSNADILPLYILEYRTLSYISGPLLFVENVHNVGFNEIVELSGPDGQVRRGQVLEVDHDRAVVQVFAGTHGLDRRVGSGIEAQGQGSQAKQDDRQPASVCAHTRSIA